MKASLRFLILASTLLVSNAWSQALFDFYPTDAEWTTMPQYCKARYVVSSTGRSSKWAYDFPTAEIESWQGRLGSCWGMAHHQCAGTVHLNRAKAAVGSTRRFELERAQDELRYAAKYCPSSNPFSATLQTTLAMTYVEQGRKTEAMATLDAAIAANPGSDSTYIAKSIILKREGKGMQGRDVLLQGLEATNGGTAELHNALGLSYFDTKEYEKAREHARKAYGMGYPLPGLKNKLSKAGYRL